jgi:3-oxoacyl-[acyl-carrier-protein] synthase-3
VPHQANRRIIDATARKLGIGPDRVIRHRRPARQHLGRLDSAGAVPRRHADGRIRKGELVLIEAMGGGFTWGRPAALVGRHRPARLSALDL